MIESELQGTKIFIAKATPKIGPNKYFFIDSLSPSTYKTKDLIGEKNNRKLL